MPKLFNKLKIKYIKFTLRFNKLLLILKVKVFRQQDREWLWTRNNIIKTKFEGSPEWNNEPFLPFQKLPTVWPIEAGLADKNKD